MRRNVARHRTMPWTALTAAALLTAGCAGADEPVADQAAPEPPAVVADAAPAAASDCSDGVIVEWEGAPAEKKFYAAMTLSKVDGSGDVTMLDAWKRDEKAGLSVAKDVTDAQQAVVDDAVAGGLLDTQGAPTLGEPQDVLGGETKGKYLQYAYVRHVIQEAVASCADGSAPVDVERTTFEEIETGFIACDAEPDPVAQYVASDAIVAFCDRG